MVIREISFRLMGANITVKEKYDGEFEEQRKLEEAYKYLSQNRTVLHQLELKFNPPTSVMDHIASVGGTNADIFLGKFLDESDVDVGLNRLINPESLAFSQLLSRDEMVQIMTGRGLEVIAIDLTGKIYTLTMKFRPSSGSLNEEFMVTKEWSRLVRTHRLQRLDTLMIWCFRVGIERKLRLAVWCKWRETSEN